jgi:large subunit ribosomal protein L21
MCNTLSAKGILSYTWLTPIFPVHPPGLRRRDGESEDWRIKTVYAIIRSGGRQYRADVGKIIDVERLPHEINAEIEITDVLLVGDDDDTVVGLPVVDGAVVKATIIDQFRGKKVIVYKYRQRTNYRRRYGHRQYYTRLRIDDIAVK